jgi:ATP-dependent Clp protease ATP-binding subunit ClpC
LARDEARRLGHNFIGTEHLLLGLTDQPGSAAMRVLAGLGADVAGLRVAVETIVERPLSGFMSRIGRGDQSAREVIGLTKRSQKALGLARDEADRHGAGAIGTAHLLLGLLAEPEGVAHGVLVAHGVALEAARAQVAAARE